MSAPVKTTHQDGRTAVAIREYPLEGFRTRDLNVLPDERGFSAEILRQDWQDFIDEWILQVNLKYSYSGEPAQAHPSQSSWALLAWDKGDWQ